MTDNLLQKLEDKVMTLLAELESARNELGRVRQENAVLKTEKINYGKKLQTIVTLLDTLDVSDVRETRELELVQNTEDQVALA